MTSQSLIPQLLIWEPGENRRLHVGSLGLGQHQNRVSPCSRRDIISPQVVVTTWQSKLLPQVCYRNHLSRLPDQSCRHPGLYSSSFLFVFRIRTGATRVRVPEGHDPEPEIQPVLDPLGGPGEGGFQDRGQPEAGPAVGGLQERLQADGRDLRTSQ